MACGEQPAEEGDGSGDLVEHRTEPRARRVAIHHEHTVEGGQLQDWCCRQRILERLERHGRVARLVEAFLLEQLGERGSDDPKILDKLAVVPRKTQESSKATRLARHRPQHHGVHLVLVHGDPVDGDRVAKVGHRGCAQRAFGAHHGEVGRLHHF
jgi:hypothetical protein